MMMPPGAASVDRTATHGTNRASSSSSKYTHFPNTAPSCGEPERGPTNTVTEARATSTPVMLRGASCGSPWPRYSPKKVIRTALVM